jgi:hypothetical protein
LPKKSGENFSTTKKNENQEYFAKKSGKVAWHNVEMKQIQINQCFNEESSLGAAAAGRPNTG